jgi:hypothetical protein
MVTLDATPVAEMAAAAVGHFEPVTNYFKRCDHSRYFNTCQ